MKEVLLVFVSTAKQGDLFVTIRKVIPVAGKTFNGRMIFLSVFEQHKVVKRKYYMMIAWIFGSLVISI